MKFQKHLLLFFILISGSIFSQKFKKNKENDSLKKVTFAAVPIINYNRSFGFIGGAMTSMYYKVNKKDTISPSSSTMLMGIYSTSNTYFTAAIQQFYLAENSWRVKLGVGTGQVFFQYFQEFASYGGGNTYQNEDGEWVDYTTKRNMFFTNIQRKIIPSFYVGIETNFSLATTEFDSSKPSSSSNINSLGYNLLLDSRDNVNYPTKGWYVQFKNKFIREGLGSTSNFDSFELAANYFWDVYKNNKSVLVSRFYSNIATGNVPFEGENVIGQNDLRGYSEGKYRGKQVYAVQTELRQHIHKKFGMIGFLGVGSAVDAFNEISDSELLPSVGIGFRYLMIPQEKINIGIDFGVGKDDWSLAFKIGETFGR